jgi:hypothetical protein
VEAAAPSSSHSSCSAPLAVRWSARRLRRRRWRVRRRGRQRGDDCGARAQRAQRHAGGHRCSGDGRASPLRRPSELLRQPSRLLRRPPSPLPRRPPSLLLAPVGAGRDARRLATRTAAARAAAPAWRGCPALALGPSAARRRAPPTRVRHALQPKQACASLSVGRCLGAGGAGGERGGAAARARVG